MRRERGGAAGRCATHCRSMYANGSAVEADEERASRLDTGSFSMLCQVRHRRWRAMASIASRSAPSYDAVALCSTSFIRSTSAFSWDSSSAPEPVQLYSHVRLTGPRQALWFATSAHDVIWSGCGAAPMSKSTSALIAATNASNDESAVSLGSLANALARATPQANTSVLRSAGGCVMASD